MNSAIDRYLKLIEIKARKARNKFSSYLTSIGKNKDELNIRFYNKYEIEKSKMKLKRKYAALGQYVSEKTKNDNVYDFSYDDKFMKLNDDIKKIKDYINSFSNENSNK